MNEVKNVIKYFKKERLRLIIPGISLLLLILLTIFTNFIVGFIVFILINLIWFVPYFKIRKRTKEKEQLIEQRHEMKENELESRDDMSQNNKNSKKKKWKIILLALLGLFILLIIIFIIFFIYVSSTAKFDPNNLYTKEASILYDSEGKEFAKLGSEMRQKIKYDEISEELINAIVATEDSRFFEHNGFDLPRFIKAASGQALGKNAGGASTLTMQVSKNQFTSTTSSGLAGIKRKFTDIYLSIFQIEKNYSKEQIMEFYVNSYYLGSGTYGVEQASRTYFGKNAKDLNLSEAALLAGMYQAPTRYNPYKYPEAAAERRNTVLTLMVRHGYITQEEYDKKKKELLNL